MIDITRSPRSVHPAIRTWPALAALALAACSGGDQRPPPGTSSGGAGGSATTSGTGATATNSGTGGATSTLPNDLGTVPVVDEPDVAGCVENQAATPATVQPASDSPPGYDRIQWLGGNWLASGTIANGFILFDAAGAKLGAITKSAPDKGYIAASTGSTIAFAGISAGSVGFEVYDATAGGPLLATTLGSTDGAHLAIGGWGGNSLVVWQDGGTVTANGIDETGNVELPFTLGTGLQGSSLAADVARDPAGFAVAWSGQVAQKYATSFARTTIDAVLPGTVVEVASGTREHSLVRMVHNSVGYALLFNAEGPPAAVYVLSLNGDGTVVGPAHRILGATQGWDLAAYEDRLGLIATRSDGTLAYRSLNPDGSVAAPWVCLGAASADSAHRGGIAPLVLAKGFQIIARGDDASEYTLAVDPPGTGVP